MRANKVEEIAHRGFVGAQMFCPKCRSILDYRRSVSLDVYKDEHLVLSKIYCLNCVSAMNPGNLTEPGTYKLITYNGKTQEHKEVEWKVTEKGSEWKGTTVAVAPRPPKPAAKPSRRTRSAAVARGTSHPKKLEGGPYNGAIVQLSGEGSTTHTFEACGMYGRYAGGGNSDRLYWEPIARPYDKRDKVTAANSGKEDTTMSAYVCEDKTINRIVAVLVTMAPEEVKPLNELGYDLTKKQDAKRLANDMFALNVESVEQRYGKGEAKKFRPLDFKYRDDVGYTTEAQFLKSLQCFTYQSCEGDCDRKPLYLALNSIEKATLNKIAAKHGYTGQDPNGFVNRLPEYDRAQWS